MNENTVAIIFGRFNPPHQGHVAAWEIASQNPNWYVSTNPDTQDEKNPLPLAIKTHVMKSLFPKLKTGDHLIQTKTWLTLADLVYQKHGKVQLQCVTDEDWVVKTLIKYNGKTRKDGRYEFESITKTPAPRLSSASALRAAVASNDETAFYQAAGEAAKNIKYKGKSYFALVREYLGPYLQESLTESQEWKTAILRFQTTLNPSLWQDMQLKPQVRITLLKIAGLFERYLDLPDLQVSDVTVSGSNAAYTYGPQSDIDLHLVISVPKKQQEFMRKYLDAKKNLFNQEHELTIKSQPVEVYAQFSDQPHESAGIYSLTNNQWITKPQRISAKVNHSEVRQKTLYYVGEITRAIVAGDDQALEAIMKRLRSYRKQALETTGEGGSDNVTFKVLRNLGILDMLTQAKLKIQDTRLSLPENQNS